MREETCIQISFQPHEFGDKYLNWHISWRSTSVRYANEYRHLLDVVHPVNDGIFALNYYEAK